jgi:hypothetical protein
MKNKKKSLYIETTIPSYATSRENKDILIAARQSITKLFWERDRRQYSLVVSQYVIDECSFGDPETAQKRLDFLKGIPVLEKSEETEMLGVVYQDLLGIPEKAKTDCFHLAICVLNHVDFLLSWNFTHLGLASYIKAREYNDKRGLWTPVLVTPENIYGFIEENL